ncbi:MAG: aldolase [Microbacteriaceae bacterium]|jgi:4-hydroxy-2-oxoheptanedioate aldolase|nr:aldolase [Microbacteriaceae bacterium]
MTPAITGAGLWCSDVTKGFVARAANAAFDWLCLDLQHGRIAADDAFEFISALPSAAPPVAIRVASNDAARIGAALDSGADAVIVPSVSSAAEAARAVDATFYPPLGTRSWGQYAALAGGVGRPAPEVNSEVLCAVMIETIGGYREVEAIATVTGVGMLFVGPYDLALALDTTVEGLLADGVVLRRIVDVARRRGIGIGAFAGNPAAARRFGELGYECLAIADDSFLIAAGATAALEAFRAPKASLPASS